MIRANLDSIIPLSPLVRIVRAEEFDLMVGELEELRRRDRARVDLAYEERAAVVAYLREEYDTDSVRMAADEIERGEHRREEER